MTEKNDAAGAHENASDAQDEGETRETSGFAESSADPRVQNGVEETGAEETGAEEIGGRKGPDPTRYGDWENQGKCVDF